MLIDTGCTWSSVQASYPLTNKTQAFSGVSQTIMRKPFTIPLDVYWDDQKVTHQFLYNPECSIGLMGRDLLSEIRLQYLLQWKGLTCHHHFST